MLKQKDHAVKLAHWFSIAVAVLLGGVLNPFATDGERTLAAQESGSTERPRPIFPPAAPFDPLPQESGSIEDIDRPFPDPFDPMPQESGSLERPGHLPVEPQFPDPGESETPSAPPRHTADDFSASEDRGSPVIVSNEFPDFVGPVVILLAGLFLVGWSLFRMGLFNPYTATLWPKRLELCMEIALRMDDFMTACREENFTKCQLSLDAMNHLNGRRSILLSNEINAAVNKFVELAVNAKVSKEDQAFQEEFNRQYERVIEALRVTTRQEELTLEVLRSLTKAQGPHSKLREPPSDE